MDKLEREKRDRKPQIAEAAEGIKVHRNTHCRGFGEVIGMPGVTQLIGQDLSERGFRLDKAVRELGFKLRYGSDTCQECTAWLRRN